MNKLKYRAKYNVATLVAGSNAVEAKNVTMLAKPNQSGFIDRSECADDASRLPKAPVTPRKNKPWRISTKHRTRTPENALSVSVDPTASFSVIMSTGNAANTGNVLWKALARSISLEEVDESLFSGFEIPPKFAGAPSGMVSSGGRVPRSGFGGENVFMGKKKVWEESVDN